MSAPPFPLRNILHRKAHKFLYFALFASVGSAASWFAFYTVPRYKKYQNYLEHYDPYQRTREICSYPVKFLHTCPSELVKRAEEKGLQIGSFGSGYEPPVVAAVKANTDADDVTVNATIDD